jgi:16S rRNA (guanine966-N2)-methyltransferase
VRIVGGRFGGRRLVVPKDPRVRPTADRVREAWMSILGESLEGARVLDLYAGSGALGLEALSRGAESATFVELNPPSLEALRANIAALGVEDSVTVNRGDAYRYADKLGPDVFDLAFADPPYAHDAAARLVALFRRTPFARILSVEHAADQAVAGDETRRYGDTALTFIHRP